MSLGIGERLTQVPAGEIEHYLAVPEMVHNLVEQLTKSENFIASATARLGQFEVAICVRSGKFFIKQIIDYSRVDVQHFGLALDLVQVRRQILEQLATINRTGHNIVLTPTISYGQRSG